MKHTQPTAEQIRAWENWIVECPESIRATIVRLRIDPWTLYRLKTTGQRVFILSFFESDTGDKVMCRVAVTGEFNLLTFERSVFGIDPEDLEECDLPEPDEPMGSLDLPIEVIKELHAKYPTGAPPEVMEDLIVRYPLKKTR